MSHYTQVATEIKDKECLALALEKLGFDKSAIEVGENLELKNYSGNKSGHMCEIRIKGAGWGSQNKVGNLCNDIGFERTEDGTYKLHVCDYAERKHKGFRTNVKKHYESEVVKKFARQQHYYVSKEEEVDGEIFLEISVPY